jgi:hypothetical protein
MVKEKVRGKSLQFLHSVPLTSHTGLFVALVLQDRLDCSNFTQDSLSDGY